MPLTSVEKNQEILSLALEDRSSGYQDLVSNSCALLHVLQSKGKFKEYSGPRIRERLLYTKTGSAVWYNGFGFLNPVPTELFNDAEYTPKMVAVAITLANEDILNNEGENQLLDMMESHIAAAESELEDEVDISLHGNGTRFGGRELGGLQLAVPTVNNSGTYAGIDRGANAIWRTSVFDANSFATDIGTQVTATTVRPMLNRIMTQRARGKKAADLLLMSAEHYAAYDAATVAIQRVNDVSGLGKLGFTSLKYFGAGRSADIVLEGGIGSNMPANTTYGLDTDNLWVRYHPERNFNKIGKAMVPINQDAVVQYIGFMGEVTMTNPLFQWKFYDSNPAA
ncbi:MULTISPECIES: phage major capsid protein [unclassified Mesorhizobium]|uniref:phage major capsid protein n=1 Tax=unclassified Mesorhizobium TaxID=325217 RepID=UPI000FCA11BB|nr:MULTISPECIES: phage major capsid protein [unclassified Mesorhizobium]RUX96152.1 phage major capsid protein [Mesorhizobium sp. M7D.F.Ca.US.004.01.2.1]RVA26476.1 phage major capsid protein [Mesorhizobium sp. M7D.F.Ca.US.004.03.1.1]